jgi:hypothetical protein
VRVFGRFFFVRGDDFFARVDFVRVRCKRWLLCDDQAVYVGRLVIGRVVAARVVDVDFLHVLVVKQRLEEKRQKL